MKLKSLAKGYPPAGLDLSQYEKFTLKTWDGVKMTYCVKIGDLFVCRSKGGVSEDAFTASGHGTYNGTHKCSVNNIRSIKVVEPPQGPIGKVHPRDEYTGDHW